MYLYFSTPVVAAVSPACLGGVHRCMEGNEGKNTEGLLDEAGDDCFSCI